MKIKFACPACAKPHAVDASLAGKKGRCKDCGAVMRVPEAPRPATVRGGPAIDDLYGFDEEAAASSAPLPSRRAATEFDEPADPTGPRRARPSGGRKKANRGEPWNLPLRYLGIKCTMMAVAGSILGFIILAFAGAQTSKPLVLVALIVLGLACLIGIPGKLLTWISVVGAFVSLIRGNGRAFSGESPGAQVVWGLAVLLSMGEIGLFLAVLPTAIYSARQAADRRDGLAPDPGAPGFAAAPGFPGDPGFPAPPGLSLPPGVVITHGTVTTSSGPATTKNEASMSHLERQLKQVADANTELAEAFERPPPQAPFGYFLHFLAIPGVEHQRIEARTRIECHPLPSAEQAKALRERFAGPLEQSLRHVVKALRAATEWIQGGPETPWRQRALVDVAAWEARAEEDLARLEAAGSDDLDWFRRATTPKAGERPNEYPHIPSPTREEQLDRNEQMRALEFAMRRLARDPER